MPAHTGVALWICAEKEATDMGFEFSILDFIQGIRTPALDTIMCFITKLGNAGILWILLAAVLIVMVALVFDVILCNGILKNLVGRIRPCDINTTVQLLVPRPTDFSFPSGHTAASFTAVTALYCAGEKKLWKISLVLAVLIAFSRLYLYVHYPTDILGGILVGLLCGYIGSVAGKYLYKTAEKKLANR